MIASVYHGFPNYLSNIFNFHAIEFHLAAVNKHIKNNGKEKIKQQNKNIPAKSNRKWKWASGWVHGCCQRGHYAEAGGLDMANKRNNMLQLSGSERYKSEILTSARRKLDAKMKKRRAKKKNGKVEKEKGAAVPTTTVVAVF